MKMDSQEIQKKKNNMTIQDSFYSCISWNHILMTQNGLLLKLCNMTPVLIRIFLVLNKLRDARIKFPSRNNAIRNAYS